MRCRRLFYRMISDQYLFDGRDGFMESSTSTKHLDNHLTHFPKEKRNIYGEAPSSSISSGSFPINLATTGVKMTVGGNRMGEAALCAA